MEKNQTQFAKNVGRGIGDIKMIIKIAAIILIVISALMTSSAVGLIPSREMSKSQNAYVSILIGSSIAVLSAIGGYLIGI